MRVRPEFHQGKKICLLIRAVHLLEWPLIGDYTVDSLQIFNIQILIILWLWALLGLKFLITFKISYVENSTNESDLHGFLVRTKGSLPLLLTREHCFEMKSLKSSAFSLKLMINLPLCNRGKIQGIFLLFRKVFNIDQYNFGVVLLSNSLSDRCE